MEGEKKTPFSVWPTDTELTYFKTHNLTPSDFFHQSFTWMQNGQKYGWIKEISSYLLIIILGLGFFGLSYMIYMIIPKILMIILSIFCISFGTLAILLERRNNGQRFRHTTT